MEEPRIVDLYKALNVTGTYVPLAEILDTVMNGCDGAVSRDGTGFNRDDLRNNVHDFVEYLQTDPKVLKAGNLKWALHMAVFYQRQWLNHFPAGTLENVKAVQRIIRERYPF